MVHVPEYSYWGVATAAYQIEGAVSEDGRGESIWDRFCATPGHIQNNDIGLVYVDYPTQRRILKDSGQWYRDMIAGGR